MMMYDFQSDCIVFSNFLTEGITLENLKKTTLQSRLSDLSR